MFKPALIKDSQDVVLTFIDVIQRIHVVKYGSIEWMLISLRLAKAKRRLLKDFIDILIMERLPKRKVKKKRKKELQMKK